MGNLIYLVEGKGQKAQPSPIPITIDEHVELLVRGPEQKLVAVPKIKKEGITRKRRIPEYERTPNPIRKLAFPTDARKIAKVIIPPKSKEVSTAYFSGDGSLLVKYQIGEDQIWDGQRYTAIAHTSMMDALKSGVSISGYNKKLEATIKLSEEGFYQARKYIMERVNPHQVRRSKGRKDGKRYDNTTIDDYRSHSFYLKRRETIVVIQTPLMFNMDELVTQETGNEEWTDVKKGIRLRSTERRKDIYDALVSAYTLLRPAIMPNT